MKLSSREKIMLSILAFLLVTIFYYQLLTKPQLAKYKELTETLAKYGEQIGHIEAGSAENSPLKQSYKIMNARVASITEGYFPEILQERIILILDEMITEAQLEVFSIGFSEIQINEIAQPIAVTPEADFPLKQLVRDFEGKKPEPPAAPKPAQKPEDSAADVKLMEVTLQYEGTYAQIESLVKEIEESDRKIHISGINMSRATDSNTLTGNIILHFYSFPKLHQQDEDYYKWDIENDYGKDNPFASQPAGSSTAPANTTQPLVADFVMTIKPVTSDLPTVVLGRTEDPQRNTYVFGDNLGYEAVEFKVKKENGGYYYKYRTEYESYPKDYENEWVSFQPKGDEIGINIYSNPRNTPSDQNGVSLTLINETDLKLRVYVNNEDKARPRLRIANMSGAVSVTER